MFKYLHLLSLETGHSRIEADNIDRQATVIYNKKCLWSNCSERVEFVNKQSNIDMIELNEFHCAPGIFKQIFKGSTC